MDKQINFFGIFNSKHGEELLAYLHQSAGTKRPVFRHKAGQVLDPLEAAYRDGRQSMVWEIEANILRNNLPETAPSTKS
jgi:hypothetical protein